MHDCIFCKIVNGEIPSDIVYSDYDCVVFNDINPKDKTHLLIVTKKHIPSLDDLSVDDAGLIEKLMIVAKNLAKERSLAGYRLQINVGEGGGQEIFHLHIHLISKFY